MNVKTRVTKMGLLTLFLANKKVRDEAEKRMAEIRAEMRKRLKKGSGEVWGNYTISINQIYSFPNATIEGAKQFDAVIVEEKINTPLLKKLYLKGAKLPFKPQIDERISVREVVKKKE